MFGKVIKHEFKSTYTIFLQMFGGILLLSLFTIAMIIIVFNSGDLEVQPYSFINGAFSFSLGLWIIAILTVSVVSFVFIVKRFYNTMVGKGAYLTYGLPVSASALVGGKLLVSLIWKIITKLVILASIFMVIMTVLFRIPDWRLNFEEIRTGLAVVKESYYDEYMSVFRLLLFLPLMFLIYDAFGIISWYFASVVGMQARKHKILTMLATILGLFFVMQIISGILMISDSVQFVYKFGLESDNYQSVVSIVDFQTGLMIKSALISLTVGIILFIGTANIVKRKPNIA